MMIQFVSAAAIAAGFWVGFAPLEPASPVIHAQFQAEDQSPTGKFLNATETRPILEATKGSWVAVRDWDGQDLVYVTHLWAWRCGTLEIRIGLNGATPEPWPLPECHLDTAQPAAILDSDGLPYRAFEAGSVQSIEVQLTLDDLSEMSATYERGAILIP